MKNSKKDLKNLKEKMGSKRGDNVWEEYVK